MARPLTFGIEFEFTLAVVLEGNEDPDPSEKRQTHFDPTAEDYLAVGLPQDEENQDDRSSQASSTNRESALQTTLNAIRVAAFRHISETLLSAGIRVNQGPKMGVITCWEIVPDQSVVAPETYGLAYSWVDVEVKSPAYTFTPENLAVVKRVCEILTSTYVVDTNPSTGLHVHVGDGDTGFEFQFVKDMFAFLYAFEPQLDTLHPTHRLSSDFCVGIRDRSFMVEEYQKEHGERMTPIEGVIRLWGVSVEDGVEGVVRLGSEYSDPKNGKYNFKGLTRDHNGQVRDRKTVEWRQYRGTMDGQEAVMWVQTVVGIVAWVRSADAQDLRSLFDVPLNENWEKLGDGRDAVREKEIGPALADGRFTIVHLLQHMDLHKQAEYDLTRLYKHTLPKRIPKGRLRLAMGVGRNVADMPPLFTTWDHVSRLGDFSSAVFARMEMERKIWEGQVRIEEEYERMYPGEKRDAGFVPEHVMWPKHTTIVVPDCIPESPIDEGEFERGTGSRGNKEASPEKSGKDAEEGEGEEETEETESWQEVDGSSRGENTASPAVESDGYEDIAL